MSFLPSEDQECLAEKGITYEEHEQGGRKAIVLKDRPLPSGRYSIDKADILIVLPRGYPDTAPDMFYLLPWAKLKASGTYPRKADHAHQFGGESWQRWSRHCKDWRPGLDGIRTMLKRIEYALEVAE